MTRANSNRPKWTFLRRQLDEQLAESLSRVSERSQLRSQVQETWSDEIIKVPKGDACLSAEGEKCSPSQNRAFVLEDEGSSQGTSMRGVCSKLLSRVCWKWSQRTTAVRIQLARVFTNIDDEPEMSRRHEQTRRTEQKDPFFTGGLTTIVLAVCDTRTLRVWFPRAAAPG